MSRAKEKGVTHLALTDHDTTQGLHAAQVIAKKLDIGLINGIEFSTQWLGRGIHIVGLNIDPNSKQLQETVSRQALTRVTRAKEIGERLAKVGVPGAYEGARKIATGVVVRPHFGRYLINNGYVTSMNAAFKKYLGEGKAGDVPLLWVDMPEVVDTIRSAGGVAVLAHPGKYKLTRTKLKKLLECFKECGGGAMEVISGRQKPNDTSSFADLVEEYNLYASCGSDFHVPGQPWQELGAFGTLPDGCKPVWDAWS